MPNYFLVSLANRHNLDLCIKHALAGFTNSLNGFWTYLEIDEGDFISFLYGARVWHLFRVSRKAAFKDAEHLPPWPPVSFKRYRRTYYFPFRLHLEPVRDIQESLVRREFAYVAENLLLRGGYGKTHFQADQTTLQSVSEMGQLYSDAVEALPEGDVLLRPSITFTRSMTNPPDVYLFSELILQALIKKHLRDKANLGAFLSAIGLDELAGRDVEVLGERALPEGHVDILLKDATPIGVSSKVAIEVKRGDAKRDDIDQLGQYVSVMGGECRAGVLIARAASSRVVSYAKQNGLRIFLYDINHQLDSNYFSFEEILDRFQLKLR